MSPNEVTKTVSILTIICNLHLYTILRIGFQSIPMHTGNVILDQRCERFHFSHHIGMLLRKIK